MIYFYVDDEDLDLYSSDVDLIYDLGVATGSNADGTGSVQGTETFQILLLVVLGIIAGILLVGSGFRRFG